MLGIGEPAFSTLIGAWIDHFPPAVPEDCYGPELSKMGPHISVNAEIASTIYW